MKFIFDVDISWTCKNCGERNWSYIENLTSSSDYIKPEDYEEQEVRCKKCGSYFYVSELCDAKISIS